MIKNKSMFIKDSKIETNRHLIKDQSTEYSEIIK